MAAVAVDEAATPGGALGEEIKPYSIHISSRYLDLTKQKLEITRLPHELADPKSDDWWAPKPRVEPLIDFWLEQYSWRAQEDEFNAQLPQFRTAFTIPESEAPIRTHFLHIRSTYSNALPLLLIPPFPFSNLSFGHIVKYFTDPDDVSTSQPFHLVVPSLPGLGFSDALPNNTPVVSTTGDMLDSLMKRLGYDYYLATNAGSGSASPAEIDWKIASYLATYCVGSCLGVHLISPPLAQPKLQEAPLEWAKWSIASLFHAPMLGYLSEDFSALARNRPVKQAKKTPTPAQFGLNQLGLREPNTLAYALCDSPTGLLVFAMKSLRLLGTKKEFSPTEIINFTQLAWLPGPEAAMRFWAYCARHSEDDGAKKSNSRPKVAVTVFLGDDDEISEPEAAGDVELAAPISAEPATRDGYACPAWANTRFDVVYAHRAPSKSGLLAWERPELIADGVNGLATEVLRLDPRLKPKKPTSTAPLEQVVVPADGGRGPGGGDGVAGAGTATAAAEAAAAAAGGVGLASPESSLQPPTPGTEKIPEPPLTTDDGLLAPIPEERVQPHREISDETRVASDTEEKERLILDKSEETLASTSPDAHPSDAPLSPSAGDLAA
ncbi:Alpha/Beta hydrolase protein [Xylariales sp. PMI_506]|nr:Alpha/Beta hydrolase protein [Xylariales sp. PMI_506]